MRHPTLATDVASGLRKAPLRLRSDFHHRGALVSNRPRWLLLLGALGVPLSLLWDFGWESTVGIDLVWGGPHVMSYVAVAMAAVAAVWMIVRGESGVVLAGMRAPVGAWVALWGAVAFVVAFVFDRWWQASYGMAAGIWHPPQMAKAVAFFAIACGAWWCVPRWGAGVVVALIGVVSMAQGFANRQHDAFFYQLACGAYPLVLAAAAISGGGRWAATRAALLGMGIHLAAVWVLPLVPGVPETGPIYNMRDHLLPPPFPPLIVLPALAMDWLLAARKDAGWRSAGEVGFAFFAVFAVVQWRFAGFLLSPGADNWFFAGGGKQWPFLLRISDEMRTAFWPGEVLEFKNAALCVALAAASSRIGIWLGAWLTRTAR